MTFETETVLDRRRLRRRVSWWRALAILAAVLAIGLVSVKTAEQTGLTEARHIARVSLEGLITEDRDAAQAPAEHRREQAGGRA